MGAKGSSNGAYCTSVTHSVSVCILAGSEQSVTVTANVLTLHALVMTRHLLVADAAPSGAVIYTEV